jgi:hypothetical protein
MERTPLIGALTMLSLFTLGDTPKARTKCCHVAAVTAAMKAIAVTSAVKEHTVAAVGKAALDSDWTEHVVVLDNLERNDLHGPIYFRRYARGYIVHFAVRADASAIAHSTDTAGTAEISTEMYRQRHVS